MQLCLSSLVLTVHLVAGSPLSNPFKSLFTKRTVQPVVSSVHQVGFVWDDLYNRDSCTSTYVDGRELWTCRDSMNHDGQKGFFIQSTAGWTTFNSDGTPAIEAIGSLTTHGYNKTGAAYFSVQSNECGPIGFCSTTTGPGTPPFRWAIWPDSPPLPVPGSNSAVKLYTWIRNVYLDKNLTPENGIPPTSLYRSDYDGKKGADVPPVTLVNEQFYPANALPFGDYGWVIDAAGGSNPYAYLYANRVSGPGTALARVPINSIEDVTKYQYYYHSTGQWNSTVPGYNNTAVNIPNCGTGQQGTFYYSSYFGLYVWIGGQAPDDSIFMITTAPKPEGPWATPTVLYNATPGTRFAGYSWQAHPGLSLNRGNGKDIYLTFTQLETNNTEYYNILLHVLWQ